LGVFGEILLSGRSAPYPRGEFSAMGGATSEELRSSGNVVAVA